MPQGMLHITLLLLYGMLYHLCHSITSDQPSTTTARDPSTTSAMRGNCSLTPFSTELRNSTLFSHNHFRSLVARGLEENGKYVGVNAPVAARMNLMYYDCTAEYFAYDHVKTCDKKVSPREGYKENIHIFETATPLDETFVIQRAIYVWASELGENGIPLVMRFTPEVRQYKKKIIWGANRRVGCATQKCDGFYFTSCMYDDVVNKIGGNIYNIGRTCNECPSKDECIALKGLCP